MEKYRPQPEENKNKLMFVIEQVDSGEEAIRKADEFVTKKQFEYQVGFLIHHLGSRMTAASVGLTDARPLNQWKEGHKPDEDSIKRVQTLSKVTYAISSIYNGNGAVASLFLRSSCPALDYEAPLLMLRNGDPNKTATKLLGATIAFLDN